MSLRTDPRTDGQSDDQHRSSMWSRSLVIKEQQFSQFQHLFNTILLQTGRQIHDSRQTQVFNQSGNQNHSNSTREDKKTEMDTFRNNRPAQVGRTSRFKYTRRQQATGETGEADYRSREDRTQADKSDPDTKEQLQVWRQLTGEKTAEKC